MFKIDKEFKIHCSRGDAGTIALKIPYIDNNGYLKYEDVSENVYWYDKTRKKLYDEDYEESSVDLSTLTLQYYEFEEGDTIKFNIYDRKGYDKETLVSKEVVVTSTMISEDATEVDILLYETDTTFGELSNKPITYWYDITLNEDMTIVCYNEDGAQEFIQYPAKGDDE